MYKFLIVGNTLAIRTNVFDMLWMQGYTVFQAKNYSIVFEMAITENLHLIISNILMPKTDGLEMFKKP